MKTRTLLALLAPLLLSACAGDPCEGLSGGYAGRFDGTMSGALTLVVSGVYTDLGYADIEGTWESDDGEYGEVNLSQADCETGEVYNEYGVSMLGPEALICPPECEPGQSSDGCYCNGVTLGPFAGTLDASGGAGTWDADSGAAEYLGLTGSGVWSVTR
jgi:hypothetical protein